MPTLRLDGDSSGLEEAVARAQRAVQRLEDEMRAKKFPLGSPEADKLAEQLERARQSAARLSDQLDRSRAPASRWESNIRSAEAAGRLFGGRMGELTGAVGDFSDILENGLTPLGATGLAVTAIGVAAVGSVAGMVQLTQAAIDIARETGQMNAELLDAERAMGSVDRATQSLILSMGTRAAPAVASMSFALSGLITVADDTATAVGDATPDSLGSVLLAQSALTYPMTTAAVMGLAKAYGALEERGRAAAQEQANVQKQLTEFGLLQGLGMEPTVQAAARIREQQQAEARRGAEQARAEAARRAEEARRERERGLGEQTAAAQAAHDFALKLERERAEANAAFIAGAQGLQFQSLAETMAAEEEANAARVEAARRAADLVAQQWEQSYAIQRESAFTAVNAAIGLLSDLVGENREAAIAMFAVRKAAAIAEIIVATQVASAQATAQLGVAAPPAVAAIQAAGAVQVGVVAAQSVAEGVSTFGPGTQGAQSNTYNLVVEGRAVRGAVRPFGTSSRRPAGQR